MVGYAAVYPRAADETHLKYQVEGAVAPGRRGEGIGSRLVDAMLARVRESHVERAPEMPVKVTLTGLSANAAQALSTAMHEADNAAFVDHPNFTPWTDVMWKQWVTAAATSVRPQPGGGGGSVVARPRRRLHPVQRVRRLLPGDGHAGGVRREGRHSS